jgi:hypothetical protein
MAPSRCVMQAPPDTDTAVRRMADDLDDVLWREITRFAGASNTPALTLIDFDQPRHMEIRQETAGKRSPDWKSEDIRRVSNRKNTEGSGKAGKAKPEVLCTVRCWHVRR